MLGADLHRLAQRLVEDIPQPGVTPGLSDDVAGQPAQAGAQELKLAIGPPELVGMGVAPDHQRCPLGDPRLRQSVPDRGHLLPRP